jgi:hypothetical protein
MINFALLIFPLHTLAWNIPGHMLNGAIAYQILQRENPFTIPIVRSVFEKNPWYETRWKAQLDKLPEAERDEMLFMIAARWADDIRTVDKSESRLPWHYVDFPFKPEGEPASIQAMEPPQENILTRRITFSFVFIVVPAQTYRTRRNYGQEFCWKSEVLLTTRIRHITGSTPRILRQQSVSQSSNGYATRVSQRSVRVDGPYKNLRCCS